MFLIRGQRGFTIMEAVAGIVIFLVAMVGVTIVFTSGGQTIQRSVHGTQANHLASEKLAEIARLPFYIPYVTATGDQDIDDFYYNTGVAGGNPDQLDPVLNPTPVYSKGYGYFSDYPNCRMEVRVQYQKLDAGGQLGSPAPTMQTGWAPETGGGGEPFDNSSPAVRLRLIKVQVKVYHKTEGGEVPVTVEGMINDSEIESGGPQVYGVGPSGFEVGVLTSFTVYGDNFSDDPGNNLVVPNEVRIWKAGSLEYKATTFDGAVCTATMLKCEINVAASFGDAYWNITVVNKDNKKSSLDKCLYEIKNPPFITRLEPDNGSATTVVTVLGYDFGTKQTGDTVTFNVSATRVEASSYGVWNNNTIEATAPTGVTTGDVVVKNGGVDSNGVEFEVAGSVYISGINNIEDGKSGAVGDYGDRVRVYGSGFGSIQDAGDVVRFTKSVGTVDATVYNTWSNVMIECRVPAGAVTGAVVVINGGVSSNGKPVSVTLPNLSNINPATGSVGTSVTVSGAGFGSQRNDATLDNVRFTTATGTVNAVIGSWSATTIVCTVPAGAVTGNVVVVNEGVSSNALNFVII